MNLIDLCNQVRVAEELAVDNAAEIEEPRQDSPKSPLDVMEESRRQYEAERRAEARFHDLLIEIEEAGTEYTELVTKLCRLQMEHENLPPVELQRLAITQADLSRGLEECGITFRV